MPQEISSPRNPKVKAWSELKSRRGRQKQGLFLVEGARELARAVAAGLRPNLWLSWPQRLVEEEKELLRVAPATVYPLSAQAMAKVSRRQNPPGLIGVFPSLERSLQLLPRSPRLVLVNVGLEKPGNLGAIMRSADAAAVDALLVVGDADLENPNLIRASTGVVFSLACASADEKAARAWLLAKKLKLVAATPQGRRSYWQEDLSGPLALLVGSEDRGLPRSWLELADAQVKIPMRGQADSLNVSVSAALLLFEALRQRVSQEY